MYSQQQYMSRYPRQQHMYPTNYPTDYQMHYNSMSGRPYMASLQTELLVNGDFSIANTTDPTRPANWGKYQTGTTAVFSYPEVGTTSTAKAIAVAYTAVESGKGGLWAQQVTVVPGKTYRVSGYIKTDAVVGTGATISVTWKDASQVILSGSYPFARVTGTTGWTYFQGNVSTTAATAARADIVCQLTNASGKAYFANVSFADMSTVTTPTPPPTSPTPPPITGTCPYTNQVYVPLVGCQNKYYVAGGIGAFVLLLIITR